MALTPEMIGLLGILGLTVFLFVTEVFRVDVTAILVMVILGVFGFVTDKEIFTGFSQNAVMSIIAVMIIGRGLDRVGVIQGLAQFILNIGGNSKKRIIPLISGTVGIISSFMQNIGAAALFLPVVSKISKRTNIPLSQLLMPMGFCAIIGGTITLVGSSPLILLNGLIDAANQTLPEAQQMEEFGLFSVTPIGIVLMIVGIAYFMFFGKYLLPNTTVENIQNPLQYFSKHFGISGRVFELRVKQESPLMGKTIADLHLLPDSPIIVAMHDSNTFIRFLPAERKEIHAGASLAVIGYSEAVKAFAHTYDLAVQDSLKVFRKSFDTSSFGVAEVVIPHTSEFVGKSLPEFELPANVAFSILGLIRDGDHIETQSFGQEKFHAGDTLIVHSSWDSLRLLRKGTDLVVITPIPEKEEVDESKMVPALFFFCLSLILIIFAGITIPVLNITIPKFPLALSLLIGAIGMIITGVLSIDKAYRAIDWKTIFLLASLYPLGIAMGSTNTANWIAQNLLAILDGVPLIGIEFLIAILATVFTLLMSNVGATVLLIPLAISIALQVGANPASFALLVAISTSNSFLLPTHQVNALLMGPGGYKVKDYLKSGGIMTLLFLIIVVVMIHFMFLEA